MAVLDGDQAALLEEFRSKVALRFAHSETKGKVKEWLSTRLTCLPGGCPPERFVLNRIVSGNFDDLPALLGADHDSLVEAFAEASALEDAHEIFHLLGEKIHLSSDEIEQVLCRYVVAKSPEAFQELFDRLVTLLGDGA